MGQDYLPLDINPIFPSLRVIIVIIIIIIRTFFLLSNDNSSSIHTNYTKYHAFRILFQKYSNEIFFLVETKQNFDF